MVSKKICILGSFAAGKTTLVQQYVYSIFTERYLSTVGVKISKKLQHCAGQEVSLVIWDLEGKDEYADVNLSYLRGAMGFFLVADGTRRETLDTALHLRTLALNIVGDVPHILLINKADLAGLWEISDEQIAQLEKQGIPTLKTSAKTGLAVEEAFARLSLEMLQKV